jgi:hypothetical protein
MSAWLTPSSCAYSSAPATPVVIRTALRLAIEPVAQRLGCTNRSAPSTAATSGLGTLSATLRSCFWSSAR